MGKGEPFALAQSSGIGKDFFRSHFTSLNFSDVG